MSSRASVLVAALALAGVAPAQDDSRIPDEPAPLRTDLVPDRPRPVLELGDPFLGAGPFGAPWVLPTGAALQPSFLVFGTWRTALGSFDDGDDVTTELATRLDLFGNLQLSGTERLVVGLRPFDEDGRFTRYVFEPSDGPLGEGFEDELNAEIATLFFEGDFGELFPDVDPADRRKLDLGFSIGRQQLTFQEGLLIDDRIDALGITRNTLLPAGGSNLRWTAILGWDEIHRGDNQEDEDALLLGLFGEADFPASTVSLDLVYVDHDDSAAPGGTADSDALFAAASAVQRIGHVNTAFRGLTSQPIHDESTAAGQGTLLFVEVSRNPPASDDLVYANAFWGIDQFTSAARGPETGGPLGGTGILFAAVGLGSFGAPLGNRADDSLGAALGWQTFLGDSEHRRQLVLEIGGRVDADSTDREAAAVGARFQQAVGRHVILRLDGFLAGRDGLAPSSGLRSELQIKL